MTRTRRARVGLGLVLGAALLAGSLVAVPATVATAQDAPTVTIVPPLPDELDGVTAAVSPLLWQVCRSVGLAVGLVVVAGTLAGVPPEVGVPLNDVIARASGPVLLLFFEVCQQIPLPDEPPDCAVDQQVPPLPSLGRPVLLAGLLANELRALDESLDGLGVPLDGALGRAADDLLGCAHGRNPEPDEAGPDPEPDGDPDAPAVVVDGSPDPFPGPGAAPPAADVVDVPAVESTPRPDLGVPVAQPVSSTGDDGAGLAVALLVLAGLAALTWAHAGSARRRGVAS